MRMAEVLENPGNPAMGGGAKQNLSGLAATFPQSVSKESQDLQDLSLGQSLQSLT